MDGKKSKPSRMLNALPNSPGEWTEVLVALLDSPSTYKSLREAATINSPEQEGEERLARVLISDLFSVLDAARHKCSDVARATMFVGLSMLCGSTVPEGNMHKSLSEALNINHPRLAVCESKHKCSLQQGCSLEGNKKENL